MISAPPQGPSLGSPRGLRASTSQVLHRVAHAIEPSPFVAAAAGPGAMLGTLVRFCKKLFRRLMIWTVSLFVAFYVPLSEAGLPVPLAAWEAKIIDGKRFPDVFLATVAMVVLSASDLVDNVIARRSAHVNSMNIASAWMFMAAYMLFILYGMPAYSSLFVASAQTYYPWTILEGLLGVGVAGEILIATLPD